MWLINISRLRINATATLYNREYTETLADERQHASCRSRVGEYLWMHCGYITTVAYVDIVSPDTVALLKCNGYVVTAAGHGICIKTRFSTVCCRWHVTHATCVRLRCDWCHQLWTLISRHNESRYRYYDDRPIESRRLWWTQALSHHTKQM